MGSLNHLLDIYEDNMARKVAHMRHVGGLAAPRNSLELPIESSYGLYAARDNIMYAHHMTKESSGKDYYYTEAPIKKLISEEISKRPNIRSNAPSVVARLMGVDMLPFDSKPGRKLVDMKNENPMDKMKKGSVRHVLSSSNRSQQLEVGSIGHHLDIYPDQYNSGTKLNKYKPREHPQEEELQKFKKEFEAWQAARFNECSNFIKCSSPPPQLIAQEDLNREKMYLYANSMRTQSERLREPNDLAELLDPHEMLTSGSCKNKNLCYSAEGKEYSYSNGMSSPGFGASQFMNSDPKLDTVSGPTKIVILKPGPDRMNVSEDSWNNTPSTSEQRESIEDFLKEVKEQLKYELQGKCSKKSTIVRGAGIETPYWEKPSKPREIAKCIAQEVRDNVSMGFEMNLLRSESTRSYISEIQNGTDSPEFINRNTRKFLAERLRNVMKGETHQDVPRVVCNSSRFSMSDYEKGGPGQSRDTWIDNKMSYPDSSTIELEKHSRSFRGEPDEGRMPQTDLSPRNLIRSLSAPVSGTSFGKLLLEDRHILTGAQIRRKHEVVEKVPMKIKKQKKDKFNIREKVSSFRYSLTLRGRLFRRRFKSVEGSDQNKNSLFKDTTSGPTVMMRGCETHENSTEVPPSPASVSSSVYDELWRPTDYLSPISSTGGHQLEDSEMSCVFREINSNLNELRRKLDQLEGAALDETISEHETTEVELDIEDQSEAYIRDLLIASGLYDGTFSRSLSKWDPLGKPISTRVFEEVEETYKDRTNDKDQGEKVNHKMILDLLNEVLPAMLRGPVNMSRYMEKAIGLVHKPPHGRKLLSLVWDNIHVYVHPPADRSFYALDDMLARDLESNPWSRLMDDDVNALGRDIECQIIGDMIEEIVKDMYS